MTIMDAGYTFLLTNGGAPKHQGFLSSVEEVEQWASSNDVSEELRSFVRSGNLESEGVFVYTHTHSGSGMDQPTAKATLEDGVLNVRWYDQSTSCFRTCDLFWRPFVVAIRIDPVVIKSVHVHGLQVNAHTFVVGGVNNETDAFAILRGIEELKTKSDDQLRALTSISTEIADRAILEALRYLPQLEELLTVGIRWTPETLRLLGKLTSLKKLRLGGMYWSERNNLTYTDLKALTSLRNLEHLDVSFSAIDGAKSDVFAAFSDSDDDSGSPKPTRDQNLSREFARGMKTILKFPKLKELVLGAQMYPKGAKLLARHPTLTAIHGVKQLSYEVAHNLANSRLATQLTSFEFEHTHRCQLAGPIIAQLAKFTNLTQLSMNSVDTLDDAAMMELAPLVKLEQLYLPYAGVTSEGLKVLHQLPNISVLSLGGCYKIENGLDHISHLSLTHLDVRSINSLTAEHLLPIIKASPDLVDLNLRYAEKVDLKALTKMVEFKKLKFLNTLSVKNSSKGEKKLKGTGVQFYYEDQPFHKLPSRWQQRG